MNNKNVHMRLVFSVLCLVCFAACNGVEDQQPDIIDQNALPTKTISFVESGLPMTLSTDFTFMNGKVVDLKYNSQVGRYEVYIDGLLEMTMVEDAMRLDEIKSELRNDQLFSYTIYGEGADAFTSQAKLPTGEPFSFSFYRRIQLGNSAFIVTTNLESEYTMDRVKQLKKLINSLQIIQ
jgi:hypothetical protein